MLQLIPRTGGKSSQIEQTEEFTFLGKQIIGIIKWGIYVWFNGAEVFSKAKLDNLSYAITEKD